MKIGAQFYTIRDFCQTCNDFAESLKKIADIGYKTVQISGTCGYDAAWLKKELDKNGLQCVVTHTPADRLEKEPKAVAAEHSVFDCKYIGLGYYGFNDAEGRNVEDFVKRYKPTAKILKENGKYFMFHNHEAEFKKDNGVLILDRLAQEFSPEEMGFILDTYWIQRGGGDPAEWIKKLSGRVPCIHLKDYAYGAKMAVVGEGNINFDRVFENAKSSGVEFLLVEQDDCNGENPFDCLKRSYEYLSSAGLE